jgi:arabinogalactan oligomer/maltooligosaccharide transport system permease protein
MSTTAQPPAATDASSTPVITTAAAGPRRQRGRGERSRLASTGLHTLLLLAAFIAAFPVAWICYVSFGPDENDFLHPGHILHSASFANFGYVLGHTHFFDWLLTSVVTGGGATLLGVLLSASAGYAVSRMRFPGHRPLMYTFLLTQMFPVAVLLVPLYAILAALNLLDSYLGLILVYSSFVVPYCAWLLKGYFDTIPVEIDEAGRIDGLTPFGTFWRLIVPLAKPGLSVAAFYAFITAWGEVAFSSVMMLSDTKFTLAVGLTTFISQYNSQWNLMAATAVLIALPTVPVFYLVQRHLVTGLTAGGTKG